MPALTLANQGQLSAESNATVEPDWLSSANSSLYNLKASPTVASLTENEMVAELPMKVRLEMIERQSKSGQGDAFQIIHEGRTSSGGSNMTFSVQAGYGRIWDEQSMLQKLSDGHQELGCAYVSANFSF